MEFPADGGKRKIGEVIPCVFYVVLEWEAWDLLTCPRKAVLSIGARSYPKLGSRKLKCSAFNQKNCKYNIMYLMRIKHK